MYAKKRLESAAAGEPYFCEMTNTKDDQTGYSLSETSGVPDQLLLGVGRRSETGSSSGLADGR